MASNETYTEILSICIDRLHSGEAIERIVQDHPTLAGQLRPMLEAGKLTTRARIPASDVLDAQEQLFPRIEQAIDTTFTPPNSTPTSWQWIVILLIGGGLLLAGSAYVIGQPSTAQVINDTPTPSPVASPTTTVLPATVTVQPVSSPTLEMETSTRLVIEGPIMAIQQTVITIYDQQITLPDDNPYVRVLQIGDVVRVTDEAQGNQVSIEIINVLVLVDSSTGQIWRGDDCANPPPVWADVDNQAQGWYQQCASSGNAPSSGASSNNGGGGNDNDNDNDDDD